MKTNIKFLTALVIMASALFVVSCQEDDQSIDGVGSNFLRALPIGSEDLNLEGIYLGPISGDPGTQTASFIRLLRDANSVSSLNSATSGTVTLDNSLVTAYNTANGTNLVPANVTINPANFTFATGEFEKPISFSLDPANFSDFSKTYVFGVKVAGSGDYKMRSGSDASLYKVILKNKYDGLYRAVGIFNHPTAGPRSINRDKTLATIGATKVNTELGDLGASGYNMDLSVNQSTNAVTVTGYIGTALTAINQSWGPNYYDADTKVFKLHYSYNAGAPRIITETLTPK